MNKPEDFPITIEVRALPQVEPQADFLPGVYKHVNRGASASLTLQAGALTQALEGDSAEVVAFIRQAVDRVYRSCCQEKP